MFIRGARIELRMTHSTTDDNYRKKLFCDPWPGGRGPGFDKFKRDVQAGADELYMPEDDDYIWDAMNDVDTGGQGANAPALPAPGAGGHPAAVRKRKKRQKKAFEIVYTHVDNERIKDL